MQTALKNPLASIRYRIGKKLVSPVRARFEKWSFPSMEKLMKKHSKVGDHTFFDTAEFPWIAKMEAQWKDIRMELDEVMGNAYIPAFQDVSKHQKLLTQDDKWKTFFFYFYGHKTEENCARCPKTMKALEMVPGMKTAFFSILAPHKHIPHHRGPYNGVLRLHLALRVPEDSKNCKIRVGNDFGHWQEGKGMVFDDSYDHEVWNETEEIRVVLFIDFLRPLPFYQDKLNRFYVKYIAASKFILDAVGNLNKMQGRKT